MITEHKFWFNTGVTPQNRPYDSLWGEHQAWRGGTLQIVFYLESAPPAGYRLLYLCDKPYASLEARPVEGAIVIKVVGGGMLSEFAVFAK